MGVFNVFETSNRAKHHIFQVPSPPLLSRTPPLQPYPSALNEGFPKWHIHVLHQKEIYRCFAFFCIFFEILVKYKSFLKTQINWSCARYLSKNITCWYFHYYCNVPLLLININWSLPGERVLIDLCSKKFKENSFLPI